VDEFSFPASLKGETRRCPRLQEARAQISKESNETRDVTLKTGKCEGVKKFKFAGSTGLATVTVVPKLLIKSSVPERVRLVFGSKTSKGSWSEDPPCWAAAC